MYMYNIYVYIMILYSFFWRNMHLSQIRFPDYTFGFEVRFIRAQKQVCLEIRYSIPCQFKLIFSMNIHYMASHCIPA